MIPEDQYAKIKEQMPLPCIDLLVIYEGKLLLMLRNNEPCKDLWFTPGGRIFKGETLEEAVKRILQKETELKPQKIKQVATMSHFWPNAHTVTTYYTVQVTSDKITLNNEHRDHKWITQTTPNPPPIHTRNDQNSKILQQQRYKAV